MAGADPGIEGVKYAHALPLPMPTLVYFGHTVRFIIKRARGPCMSKLGRGGGAKGGMKSITWLYTGVSRKRMCFPLERK